MCSRGLRIERIFSTVIEERGESFQRIVLALHRNHHRVGGDQAQLTVSMLSAGAAVDEHVVVRVAHRLQRMPQAELAAELVEKSRLRSDEINVCSGAVRSWRLRRRGFASSSVACPISTS